MTSGALLWGIGTATQTPALVLSGGMIERASLPTTTAGAMRSRKALIEQGAELGSLGGTTAYILYGTGTAVQLLGGAVAIRGLLYDGGSVQDEANEAVIGAIGGALLLGTGGLLRIGGWAGTGAQLGANRAARDALVATTGAPPSDTRAARVRVDLRPMLRHPGAVVSVTHW